LKRARRIDLTRLAKDGYVVTTHNLTVYGLCQVCARRRRTSRLSRARPESPRKNRGVRTLAVTRE
jgi:hypothetical protein